MDQRIKAIRKAAMLTQAEFGQRLGVKGNTVTNYENGLRTPSEAVIRSICREFDVSERWLRTGEGPMMVERSPAEDIAAFVGDALSSGEDDFRQRVLRTLSHLKPEDWALLERIALDLGNKKTGP